MSPLKFSFHILSSCKENDICFLCHKFYFRPLVKIFADINKVEIKILPMSKKIGTNYQHYRLTDEQTYRKNLLAKPEGEKYEFCFI